MKKLATISTLLLSLSFFFASCTSTPSAHRGVKVSWGGKTDMTQVYEEGVHSGVNWLWDDMINYNIQEQTYKAKYHFNDKNNMDTGVEIALDYSLDANKVNLMHVNIGAHNLDVKIQKALQSAAKEVIPQYTATDLNLNSRADAENKISNILEKELPQLYVNFARIQITDVDIPKAISDAARETAKQRELNKLSEERKQEAENNFATAEWDAKTKDILSKPAMLELLRLENETKLINKWDGSLGNNNVFGSNDALTIMKGKL